MKFASLNIFLAFVISLVIIHCPDPGLSDDIGTNFFLKASKSVPRIGRSMDFDNHFLKASKSVPRIGRRGAFNSVGEMQNMRGYAIIKESTPEIILAEAGQPLWSNFERGYEPIPRPQNFHKLRDDYEGNFPYLQRMKKDLELEEPRLQREVF